MVMHPQLNTMQSIFLSVWETVSIYTSLVNEIRELGIWMNSIMKFSM